MSKNKVAKGEITQYTIKVACESGKYKIKKFRKKLKNFKKVLDNTSNT